jgi:chromosomal replication initiator protein
MQQIWENCLTRLSGELTQQQFDAWIRPLEMGETDESTGLATLFAPTRFKLDWAKNQFGSRICELLQETLGKPVELQWQIKKNSQRQLLTTLSNGNPTQLSDQEISAEKGQIQSDKKISDSEIKTAPPTLSVDSGTSIDPLSNLKPELTFASFVTGKANMLARAAAFQVADNPGASYNPFYLYGSVGLGKTHLIHAIGNAIRERNPRARVRYIHADHYVGDVVKAYQKKAFEDFKRYYHSLDVLLIDDIQFFANKARTQEEFFYAFEALVAAKKQIIITSDTYPKDLADVDDRLRSRFGAGLTVSIEPPELEMRVAILLKKAEQEHFVLDEEAAFFIAHNLRSNVRELEGAFRKVVAWCQFTQKPANIDNCRVALKDILIVNIGNRSTESIVKAVSDYYRVKAADIYNKSRSQSIAFPRQVAMYLCKELSQKSLVEIGRDLGGRDHTTVLHAVRKISDMRARDSTLNHALHILEQTIKG